MKYRFFCVTLTIISAAMAAVADDVVRQISMQTGTLDRTSGWAQVWTSSEPAPGLTMTASRLDMQAAPDGIHLDMREGSNNSSTYVLAPEAGWRVKEISLSFIGNSAADPVTVSSLGKTIVSTSGVQTLTVKPGEFDIPAITLTGNNQGITTTDFRVTLSTIEPEDYTEYPVDLSVGQLTASMGTFYSMWESPELFLASTTKSGSRVANMTRGSDGTHLDLREGTAGESNYYISTCGSRRVVGFELTFVANDSSKPVTVVSGAQELTASATPQTLIVAGLGYGQLASFTLKGNNGGILAKDFKVRVAETSPTGRGVSIFTYTGYPPYSTVYRIPVVAYIPAGDKAGRMVAVNDFRPCGADIGYGEVDFHVAYSDNGGLNWTAPFDPVDTNGNHVADGDGQGTPATSNENRDCGFGDAVLVADRETGELLMLGACGRVPIGQATRAIPQGIAIWRSNDGGETWTPWKDITESILTQLDDKCEYGKVDGFFFTAGRMVQSKYVKVGTHYRVYTIAGGASRKVNDTQCWVFYTDDFGDIWHILGDPLNPAQHTGGMEPKCEELPDGSVMLSGRAGGGTRAWNVFSYTDIKSGEGYWDTQAHNRMVTGAASCNGDPLIVPVKNTQTGAGAYLLLQSTPCNPGSRVNVGINYKVLGQGFDDFGNAENLAGGWDGYLQVTALPSAYSSMAIMTDGTIGLLFEEQTYAGRDYSEVYRNLTIEDITGGDYTFAPDTDLAVALALTRQMVDGRLAAARAAYSERTELLETLAGAADDFNAEPSTDAYLRFNRAYYAVLTNRAMDSIGLIPAAGDATVRYFDLQGRPVANPTKGLYLRTLGNKTDKIIL